MEKSRTQKSFINVGVMGLYEVVVMICGLITPRLILSTFGSTYNGMTSSITQFLSFITILRAGVAGASRVSLYRTLSVDDVMGTSRIMKATENFLRKIAYIFLGYLLVLAVIYKPLSGISVPWFGTFLLVIIIGLGTFAQYYFGLAYQTLVAADQKNYIYYLQQMVVTILNTIIAVCLIKCGASIYAVKFGSAIIFVLSPIWLNRYVSKRYKLIKNCEPDNTALKQRKDVFGLAIANIAHDNTDIVILTLFTNAKIVSVYSVYNLVINSLKKLLSVFTTGLEAAFGNMWAKKETEAIERNIGVFELLISCFVSIVFSCTIVLILPFVQLYTEGVTDVNYIQPFYAFIAISAQAFYCLRMPYLTLVQAAGHYKQTRNGSFVEAGINVIASLLLVFKYGLAGVAIGTFLADIFRTVQYAKYCCDHLIKKSYWYVVKRMLLTSLNVALAVGINELFTKKVIITSWIDWIIEAFGVTLVACLVTLIMTVVFYRKDLYATIDIVKKTLLKKRVVNR